MAATPATPQVAPRSGLVVLALLLVYVVWGSTYLGIRFALEGGALPLTTVSGARFIVAGSLMYAVLRWRGSPAPTGRQWRNLVIMGLTMLVLGNGMVVLAERSCAVSTPPAANGWASPSASSAWSGSTPAAASPPRRRAWCCC
jgi:drug/metabolite transporter (DMT)-like permease